MAWQKGPHAQAPQGVLCFPTEVAGEVTWDDEGLEGAAPPAPPPPAHAPAPAAAAHPQQHTKAGA